MGMEPAKIVISPSKIVISHDFYGIIEIETAKIVIWTFQIGFEHVFLGKLGDKYLA
jgi:hypothetical protein